MLSKILKRIPSNIKNQAVRSFSDIAPGSAAQDGVAPHTRLQFTKERLVDFGELPRGEIPEGLQMDRPCTVSTLENGVRVATETYETPLVTLGFHWSFGSRNETTESSGLVHFLQQMRFRGTTTRTRSDIESQLAALGAEVDSSANRERDTVTITVEASNVAQVFEIMGDLYQNSTFEENQVEAERETVHRQIVEQQRDQMSVTLESSMFTSYRDHQIGQPLLGVRENVTNISSQMLQDWVSAHQTGNNLVVVATGGVQPDTIQQLTQQTFGQLQSGEDVVMPNTNKPHYTPSLIFMRDDEMPNLNAGVFLEAPSYAHEDSLVMEFYQKLMGDYRADLHTATHLNATHHQYNKYHSFLGNFPDITIQNSIYQPYSDTGLFGGYLFGNEVFGTTLLFSFPAFLSEYNNMMEQVEIFRSRAVLFNELLSQSSGRATNTEIADQVRYLGRRMPRSERAIRFSAIADKDILQEKCAQWFYDVDVSAAVWGPTHHVMSHAAYNRVWKRCTAGTSPTSGFYSCQFE